MRLSHRLALILLLVVAPAAAFGVHALHVAEDSVRAAARQHPADTAALAATLRDLRGGLLQIVIATVACSAALASFTMAGFTRRLRKLSDAVRALAAGDSTARANLTGRDEVAAFGRCLDSMAAALAAAQDRLVQQAAEAARRSEALEAEIRKREEADRQRAQLEVQLRHAQKLEAIGQLAAGIAHEINTPTQYVGDNTRFLQESTADLLDLARLLRRVAQGAGGIDAALLEEVRRELERADLPFLETEIPNAVRQALEGIERVAEIVRAMKNFSHPGSREKKPFDLNEAILTTITVSRNEWKYVADVKTELDPDLPHVPCLPGEFNQAVLNLVVNAAHAIGDVVQDTGAKGQIRIRTRREGAFAVVEVADTGSGIPPAVRERMFEPFFTTKPPGKGSGQGLAIVHAVVVTKHGGTLEVESEPGQGATFRMRLPLQQEPRPATDPGCGAELARSGAAAP